MGDRVCPRCEGTGKLADPRDEGEQWRKKRIRLGLTLEDVAKTAKLTRSYLCDAELGRRNWNRRLRAAYRDALGDGAKRG